MKQTRSDSLRWIIVSVAAAGLCAVARRIQLHTAFEGDLHLPIPFAPASIALSALLLVAALLLLLLAVKQPVESSLKDRPERSLFAKDNTLFLGGIILAAFLCLIAAPVLLISGGRMWADYQATLEISRLQGSTAIPGGNNGMLTLFTGVFSALSFIALLVVSKSTSKDTKKGRLAILLPAINNSIWLMEFYRSHAANPVRWDYGILLVAIVSGTVLYLNWARLYAGIFAPRRALWVAGTTIVLSLTALMGEWTLSSALLLTSQLAAAFALLWCLPYNLRYPPELSTEEAPAEEKLEEETHE